MSQIGDEARPNLPSKNKNILAGPRERTSEKAVKDVGILIFHTCTFEEVHFFVLKLMFSPKWILHS